jgi:hypothetical protein
MVVAGNKGREFYVLFNDKAHNLEIKFNYL